MRPAPGRARECGRQARRRGGSSSGRGRGEGLAVPRDGAPSPRAIGPVSAARPARPSWPRVRWTSGREELAARSSTPAASSSARGGLLEGHQEVGRHRSRRRGRRRARHSAMTNGAHAQTLAPDGRASSTRRGFVPLIAQAAPARSASPSGRVWRGWRPKARARRRHGRGRGRRGQRRRSCARRRAAPGWPRRRPRPRSRSRGRARRGARPPRPRTPRGASSRPASRTSRPAPRAARAIEVPARPAPMTASDGSASPPARGAGG